MIYYNTFERVDIAFNNLIENSCKNIFTQYVSKFYPSWFIEFIFRDVNSSINLMIVINLLNSYTFTIININIIKIGKLVQIEDEQTRIHHMLMVLIADDKDN